MYKIFSYDLIRKLFGEEVNDSLSRDDQGFLTSGNRHVDRAEGFRIAKENDQIWHTMFDNDIEGTLTSEDLY